MAEVRSKDIDVVPPSDTDPPPVRPVPAVTVKEELIKLRLEMEELGRLNPPEIFTPEENTAAEVTVNDEPIPTLPVEDKVLKIAFPVTFKPFNTPNPVIDAPTPMLPEVVKVEPKIAPKSDNPDTLMPFENNAPLETVNEDPIPTLPVVLISPTPVKL